MKRTILFVFATLMLSVVATPVSAQSRKDKKAAKQAEWEMQQQQKAEEAALLHQMRMDSIRAVQEAREQAREDEARRKAEQQAEAEYLKSSQAYNLPCWEGDTKEYYTAHVQRKMHLNVVTTQTTALLRLAQQQMRQKIKGEYKQVVRDYFDQMNVDDKASASSHIESAGEMIIDQLINDTEESCRQMTRPDASGNVTMYLAIKVDKKELVKEVITKMPQKVKDEVRLNEQNFLEKYEDKISHSVEE